MTDMIKASNEQANKQQFFLYQAKALSERREVDRCLHLPLLMSNAVASGVVAEAEIFQAAYGDPDGRKYWEAQLSEAIPVPQLAYILSAHRAERIRELEYARIAVIRAFRDAASAGECWFTGDIRPLLAVEDGQTNFEGLSEVKVHPRAAVEWLLSRPKREHLVPNSLRRFLQSGADPTNAKASTAPTRRRPRLERAQRVIKELYPGGVPDPSTVPNVNLCKLVADKLKKEKLPDVSDDTILRAAGRRK